LDVRPIKTLAQLSAVAAFFHIKPITNEPILLRLQLVLQRTFVYVILEHIDECDAGISANVIMTHIRAHLPMMRCIAIWRTAGILGPQREYHEMHPCTRYCAYPCIGVPTLCRFINKQAGSVLMQRMCWIHARQCKGIRFQLA
jgi:hypothetical protein